MKRRVAMLLVVAAGLTALAPDAALAAGTSAGGSSGGPLCVRVPVPNPFIPDAQIQVGVCT